ncbi:MlaA family lipoprotein [Sulfurospirillum arcachonense]|uniref:MlaA family lipoprotein n=1 Tax=Sulfurospirillum arcachonense TaxID=57666 RepID=UPI00046A10EE|nr:VacJ family lipoprotein [Sulfurospirillum arcachonense]
MRLIFLFLLSFSLLFSQTDSSFDDEFENEFTKKEKSSSWDPIKGYNVQMTKFNDFVYMNIMGPVAKGYKNIVSTPVRKGVSNAFDNIKFPIRFVNNVLQLKFKNAFEETGRFIINSTYGLAGFLDLAKTEGGLNPHNEDLGQTLGYYGASDDFHIVLPLFGPSNLRDTIGLVGDSFLNPLSYAHSHEVNVLEDDRPYYFLKSYEVLNEYSLHVDEYEALRKDAVNLYPLLKNVYEQRRKKLIEE